MPRALMRLQFRPGFTLDDAVALVPYLAALGISHVYASPLFRARRGSPHGYDVVDYGVISPELGGRAGLERLAAALARRGMGIVLDIVPNHMAADARENAWWRNVLARGRKSPYAAFFDIDWTPAEPSLRGKVLLPVLGSPYAAALAAGEIRLARDAMGRPEIGYFDERFPLAPETPPGLIARAPAGLDRVLEAQHYRLAYWKEARDRINWRRFFDINGLVALRAERADVFRATHALVLDLFAAGVIGGVRVDHVDGLAAPGRYCRRLRRALAARAGKDGARPYIIVEKILASGERVPAAWGVDGTTGYDFMDAAAAVLHDPDGEAPLTALWDRLVGAAADFTTTAREARRMIVRDLFAADLERVVRALGSEAPLADRAVPPRAIRRIVTELVAGFPVYRAYGAGPDGAAQLERAVAVARSRLGRGDREALAWVRDALSAPEDPHHHPRAPIRGGVRFQQLTTTIAAKAVEDTAFYRYGRLLSRNEVGADPERFAITAEQFHSAAAVWARSCPHTLLATATHDSKRGEDVRARLAVVSEIPNAWAAALTCWMRRNDARRRRGAEGPIPSPADEAMLYQTLVAAWPARLDPDDASGVARFGERVAAWQQKAIREAKLRSDWLAIDAAYEAGCRTFLFGMLEDEALRCDIARFARRIGPAGALNGLAQTMLRLAAPGVPDLYQGTELWDETLVDPDNRRAVDFALRSARLAERRPLSDLLAEWRDGRIKQALIQRMLGLRERLPELFASGSYTPLYAHGGEAKRSLFFLRTLGDRAALVGVVRLAVPLLGTAAVPAIPAPAWRGASLALPGTGGVWRDVLDEHAAELPAGGCVPLGVLFRSLPIACRVSGET